VRGGRAFDPLDSPFLRPYTLGIRVELKGLETIMSFSSPAML
jgi:hypothetical protein